MSPSVPMIAPMLAMIGLIFLVMFWLFCTRVYHVRKRNVRFSYFRVMQTNDSLPESMVRATRNFSNQFEMPVVFFVLCLIFSSTGRAESLDASMAWSFVGLRGVHAIVHLSYNNINHRLATYALSNLVLIALWLRLLC